MTSRDPSDDVIASLGDRLGVKVFRGDLENVALRATEFLSDSGTEFFARVNGDSPFVAPELLDEGLDFVQKGYDFSTNIFPDRTYPYGIAIEVFNSSFFLSHYAEMVQNKRYREHITSFFYENIGRFNFKSMRCAHGDFSKLLLTVDRIEDYHRLLEIQTRYPSIFDKTYAEIIETIKEVGG